MKEPSEIAAEEEAEFEEEETWRAGEEQRWQPPAAAPLIDAETGEPIDIPLQCYVAYNHIPALRQKKQDFRQVDPLIKAQVNEMTIYVFPILIPTQIP